MGRHPDVIIVGAGSAGCVLAGRLSEDAGRRVLLLEAGPDYPTRDSLPPEIAGGLSLAVSHDWGLAADTHEPGRRMPVPRPRLVGGSSATNATFALRGLPSDYDAWRDDGNAGWAFDDVLPFFKRLESDHDFDGPVHGTHGPIPIRRYPGDELTPVQAAFAAAAEARGHRNVPDHNAPGAAGIGPIPMNCTLGVRQSASLTYLAQARSRPNLTIRANTLVDTICFAGGRACGVVAGGEHLYAGQVILAAGVFASPMILLRSGIGPPSHLGALAIPVRVELPGVGRNLADHPLWALRFSTPRPAGAGAIPLFQTLLTLRTASASPGTAYDAQIFPTSGVRCSILQSSTGGVLTLSASIMKPRSTGSLRLASRDPSAPPRFSFNHLSQAADLSTMLEVVREARRLAATEPLATLAHRELYPGTHHESDAGLAGLARRDAGTYHHACGTCRMGPSAEAGAVVGPRGAVHGVPGLWVIDASIIPSIPSANIHLTTLMIAERCAQGM